MEHTISVKLKIWRQRGPKEKGQFVNYSLDNVSTGSSFLEMLDMLNQQLVEKGEEPVVFDNDCREGICGMCSLYINGHPHGPVQGITTCQLHMRKFNDGDTITIEPWRSAAFPVIRDLMVDRSAFDKIQQAGGYVSFNCGGAQGCKQPAYQQGSCRYRHGLGYLHRLRRMCGCLQERLGYALRFGKGKPVRTPAPGSG